MYAMEHLIDPGCDCGQFDEENLLPQEKLNLFSRVPERDDNAGSLQNFTEASSMDRFQYGGRDDCQSFNTDLLVLIFGRGREPVCISTV